MSAQSTIMAADQCEVVYEASMHELSLQRPSQHQLLVLLSLHQLLLIGYSDHWVMHDPENGIPHCHGNHSTLHWLPVGLI